MAGWIAVLSLAIAAGVEIPRSVASPEAPLAETCDASGAPDAALFLVGDAGAPRADEPLLAALAAEAQDAVARLGRERVAIAFLGDNVYPDGLRAVSHPGRAEDERRLAAQLEAVRRAGARGLFVPGNHDWDNGGPDGLDNVKRQARYVAARGAAMLPSDGCPGPAVQRLGRRLALVAIDTQWWLHEHAKPRDAASGCAAWDLAGVEAAIAAALSDTDGRHAVVLSHHPLASGGPHGARFGWQEHLFPLRGLDRRLWIPLPVLGSLEPVARALGASPQDLPSEPYRALAASLERALAAAPPLALAAGHEHSLQLIRGGPARFQIVSGAGSAPNATRASLIAGALFAEGGTSGYVRLDAAAGGAIEVGVRTVGQTGTPVGAYRACLADAF
jgi:hypothetical protein